MNFIEKGENTQKLRGGELVEGELRGSRWVVVRMLEKRTEGPLFLNFDWGLILEPMGSLGNFGIQSK